MVLQLNLSGNELCGLDNDGGGTYNAEGITAIADALRINGGLTKISLSHNELGEEGTKAICEALEQNKTLKELDISGFGNPRNIGGTAGVKHVAKMLGVKGGLTSINMSANNLTDSGRDMTGIKELAAALGVNGGLTKMSLAGNQLEEEGTKAICEALEQNKTLKELDISGDGFGASNIGGSAGAKHVTKMLGVNVGLTSLDLCENQLCGIWTDDYGKQKGTYTADGITAITDALRVNGALTSIKLWGNQLGDKGWGAIFAAICGNKDSKIMSLHAASENIGPAGGKLIAEALRTSVTGGLTSINLSGNQLCGIWTDWEGDQHGTYTAEGITAIADALRVNGSLTEIR